MSKNETGMLLYYDLGGMIAVNADDGLVGQHIVIAH